MQKKLIAVAIAGLMSGAAFAQSNVTISGVADAYYGRLTGTGYKSYNAINSGGLSGSRLKFAGAEDIGNGLKAIFEMEQGFNMTDNNQPTATSTTTLAGTTYTTTTTNSAGGITNTRQAYVGLAGSFGAVVAGRLQTPGYYVGKFDALASAAISPQAILSKGKMIGGALGSTIAPSDNGRLNSAVAYLSPNFGGFSGVAAASTSNYDTAEQTIANSCVDTPTSKTCSDGGAWALGLNFATGPVAVGFVHHNILNYAGNADLDAKENLIGASYNAGFLTVLGSYQDAKLKNTDRNKLYQIGVVVPVGAGNIHAAYGKLDMKNDNLDSKSYTIAYTHALSKRTTAYTGYNVTDNKKGFAVDAVTGLPTTTVQTSGLGLTTSEAGGKAKGLVVGLRHTF